MKALLIDDQIDVIRFLKRALKGVQNIVFAECHSVEEALEAIAREKPEILFLDNSLCGGNEGLEIADRVKNIKIYSTTLRDSIVPEYEKRGIERIDKFDFEEIKKLILINS